MTMKAIHLWALTLAMLGAGIASAVSAAEGEAGKASIEQRMEEARRQLNEAARRLAGLHTEMMRFETEGPLAQRPMLGVLVDDSGSEDGMLLAGVTPEGGAEQAGLRAGDRIVRVNEVRLDGGGDRKPLHLYSEAMSSVEVGDTVEVEYVRDGRTLTGQIVTRGRGSYMAQVIEDQRPWLEALESVHELADLEVLKALEGLEILKDGKLDLSGNVMRVPAGLRLHDVDGKLAGYFEVDRGVLVLDSPEREDTLEAGDILLDIDGEAVTGADAALERLARLDGEVPAKVKRRGRVHDVVLDVDTLNMDQALHVLGSDRRIRIQRVGAGDQVRLEITVDD
jgi:predicted metalloprotease with PDZ domain